MAKAGAHDALVRMLDLPQPDVRDAFAQSAELLPGDGGLVRQVAERVARLTRTRPEQVQLTFAEGRVPGDEADSFEYHYTHVVQVTS